MSAKLKIKLLFLVTVCFAAILALFAGCSIGEPGADEFLTGKNAKNQSVTYYANGGMFNDNATKVEKILFYPEGSYVLVDFDQSSNISVSRRGYVFEGWYYAELDDEGKPIVEDEASGAVKMTEEQLQDGYRISNEHLYVVAKWSLDYQLEIVLVSDGPVKAEDGTEVESGSVIVTKSFTVGTTLTLADTSPWESSDHTFLQYYKDEACTVEYNGEAISKPTEKDAANPRIYAKYIEGVWTLVKNSSNVRTMFNNTSSANAYYIVNDIDCSAISLSLKSGEFNLTIEGNGHTLSNLNYTVSGVSGNTSYAMFGTLGASAKISNLTLQNVNVSVTVRSGWSSLYLFCLGKEDGAVVDNVAIDTAEMTVSYAENVVIDNIQEFDGVFESDNWLFGGAEDPNGQQTDEAFLASCEGIRVNGASLTVNGVLVAQDVDTNH